MTHTQFFEQAITLTGIQLGSHDIPATADYPMRVADFIRLNYQAVVLAWNDIQPEKN